ncbi:glutathione S-transferase family protein [Gammaproteobacteria bacterium]|nr:glutathione S-transferase family protein [Gammaproteobacteria bacterium]
MPIIEPVDKSLKDLEGLHLWHGELSSCSQRVRITLEEKNLDWKSHIISIPKNEHATPEYQAIHPSGLVPAFVDNGVLLIESCDIICYLDEKYSKFSLQPEGTKDQIIMSNWLSSADKAQADLKLLSHEFLFRPRKKMTAEELEVFSKSHNNQTLVTFIQEWQVGEIFPKEKLDHAVSRTDGDFKKLDETLKTQKWIAGEEMSLADIAWMPNIHRMNLMCWPIDRYPNLMRWFNQVKLRSSYQVALVNWENEGQADGFRAYVKRRHIETGVHVTEFGSLAQQIA